MEEDGCPSQRVQALYGHHIKAGSRREETGSLIPTQQLNIFLPRLSHLALRPGFALLLHHHHQNNFLNTECGINDLEVVRACPSESLLMARSSHCPPDHPAQPFLSQPEFWVLSHPGSPFTPSPAEAAKVMQMKPESAGAVTEGSHRAQAQAQYPFLQKP